MKSKSKLKKKTGDRFLTPRPDLWTEVVAGLTTFFTMAYIVFLQPAILSTGMGGDYATMDFDAVMMATCLSAALATALMALLANLPIAQAPGMGENFFFVFTVLPAAATVAAARGVEPWQIGLGAVFIAGVLFLVLTAIGVRRLLLRAISPSMRCAISVGIGLFIGLIGLKSANIIHADPAAGWKLNPHLVSIDLLVFISGLLVMVALYARKIRGAILGGMIAALFVALLLHAVIPMLPDAISQAESVKSSTLMTDFKPAGAMFSAPPSIAPTFMKMDVIGAMTLKIWPMILILLFMDVFDTLGTLVGVSEQAGLMRDGKLPNAGRAMISDAVGTTVGGILGTSTVTSYIESAAGVQQGGRTGVTALVVAVMFLLTPFLKPVIAMVGSYPSITTPALLVVAVMMMGAVRRIEWDDFTEAFPSMLIIIGIPMTFSISDGLAVGFFIYPLVKILGGRAKSIERMTLVISIVVALLVALYFVFLRPEFG